MNNDLLGFIWSVFGPYIGKITIGVAIILAIGLIIEIIGMYIKRK